MKLFFGKISLTDTQLIILFCLFIVEYLNTYLFCIYTNCCLFDGRVWVRIQVISTRIHNPDLYPVVTWVYLQRAGRGCVERGKVDALVDLLCAGDEDDPGGEGAEEDEVHAADCHHVCNHLHSARVPTERIKIHFLHYILSDFILCQCQNRTHIKGTPHSRLYMQLCLFFWHF